MFCSAADITHPVKVYAHRITRTCRRHSCVRATNRKFKGCRKPVSEAFAGDLLCSIPDYRLSGVSLELSYGNFCGRKHCLVASAQARQLASMLISQLHRAHASCMRQQSQSAWQQCSNLRSFGSSLRWTARTVCSARSDAEQAMEAESRAEARRKRRQANTPTEDTLVVDPVSL